MLPRDNRFPCLCIFARCCSANLGPCLPCKIIINNTEIRKGKESYCLIAAQARKGNFQKTCHKTFYSTCRPRLYVTRNGYKLLKHNWWYTLLKNSLLPCPWDIHEINSEKSGRKGEISFPFFCSLQFFRARPSPRNNIYSPPRSIDKAISEPFLNSLLNMPRTGCRICSWTGLGWLGFWVLFCLPDSAWANGKRLGK